MVDPATKIERLRHELFDPTIRKHELWLQKVRRELDGAYKQGLISQAAYHHLTGVVYAHLGQLDNAIEHGEAAVQLDGNDPAYAFNLACSLSVALRFEEAAQLFETAGLENDVAALACLADAQAELGNFKSARIAFRKAAKLADYDNIDHLWRLSVSASAVELHVESVKLFARLLARRNGVETKEAEVDPLMFILTADNAWLNVLSDMIPAASIQHESLRRTLKPADTLDEEGDSPDAEIVLNEWADLRARANAVVFDAGD